MDPTPVEMPDAASWRQWLEQNHESQPFVWLVLTKKHVTTACIRYDEAVEQALCFGWIDGMVRRLDEDRYVQRFSPRKSGSGWSESNIRRVRRLVETGQMTSAGLRSIPRGLV